ncbi:colicin M activity protein Cma [Escherichia coli]|nr:colicin M activity protein Cma [Escherichia coli]
MNMKQMSGNVTTPIVALAHYLWGNGAERSVNIANIGLKISPMKINQIKDIIKSGVVGTFPVSTKFTHALVIIMLLPVHILVISH